MPGKRWVASLLASVTSDGEACLAVGGGADIIDCKDPAAGALGALPHDVVRSITAAVPHAIPVSATIGDLACEPHRVGDAVTAMAATGVDLVKVGLFPGEAAAMIARLGTLPLGRARLVGVLFADLAPDFSLLDDMGRAGFAGAMLDTAGKGKGSLFDCLSAREIETFLARARERGLFAGLAGSLRLVHVPLLLTFGADVLGFRGALCRAGKRETALDEAALKAIRSAIPRTQRESRVGEALLERLSS